MSSFEWDSTLSLGSPDVDREHQALFRILHDLDEAVERGDRAQVEVVLERLVSYSNFHFRSEEELMRARRYPVIEDHIREHRKFTSRLTLLKYQPYRDEAGRDLLEFIRTWVRGHILQTDQRFGEFLNRA